ncbi:MULTISPECIES: TVP38/TMEM64 family protein [Loigolactobacillus]|uniref:TVP38/TMEM64 family membrane protein n=1 Tax=Loigolactobacillus backii TaxID=375175 RepID=A0A192GZU6_9LACO|nr:MULTISPECIES: TVP38/TMEM64 family protein [Loigolactobacillus]ANK61522.1 hypothetical protein AYR53_01330 [Loigolactobacillus backii]ANK69280.1 hypothetical protein AYR56_03385 [Loigolactobacillus backii]MDA5388741.1 TVP38/TMEM64 family protein [Loigolactobacillus backii]MDA5391234.1 TVP38/TMEM64 family protein [Loigolactobacillus backii]
MSTATSRRLINLISLAGLGISIWFTIYCFQLGVFKNTSALQGLVEQAKFFGPLLFIVLQIVQVVIPIIPGGISLAAGVLIFGPVEGFVYNYIGIVLGSIIAFLLGRRFGKPLVHHLISDKIYNKYIGWLDNQNRFTKLFAIAIFLPVAPDDVLCLLAGLTKMSLKTFSLIIILGKPATILAYSYVLVYGGTLLSHFI